MDSTDDQLRARVTTKDLVAIGATINGDYAVVSQIGKGGMGRVFLAEDLTLGRKVAVKVIDFPTKDVDQQRDIIERFRREAVAAARVSHPNVIVIHTFKEISGQHVQVMEFIDGRTLREELKAQPKKAIQPDRAVKIVIEFLEGVGALHASGLCHRDLKPANVMLTHDGDRVKILDLGLVKFADNGDPSTDMTLTQYGKPMGSPLYMAPEQINNLPDAREIDVRTDLYAVGAILYELLTGKPPFTGNQTQIFDGHRFTAVPKMVSPYGELPAALQAIVVKAMAKKSGERYQSADKMRDALKRLFKPQAQKRSLAATLGLASIGPLVIVVATILSRLGHQGESKPVEAKTTVEATLAPHREATPPPVTPAPVTPAVSQEKVVISVPPPAEVNGTTEDGCKAYRDGHSADATAILTKIVAKSPGDVEALFCLCGSYADKSSLASSERGVCQSFLNRASPHDKRKLKVKVWLSWGAR